MEKPAPLKALSQVALQAFNGHRVGRWWRKAFSLVLALWAIVTLTYLFLYRLPGDPARIIMGPQASAETVTAFRHTAGLDRSLGEQYGSYLSRVSRLDLGVSFSLRRPVVDVLRERGGVTLRIAALAMLAVLCVGFVLPIVLQLLYKNPVSTVIEHILGLSALIPPYVLATVSLIIGAGWLGWVKAIFDPTSLISWCIPAMVLSAYPASLVLKVFSARLTEEFQSPYAKRARALGLSRSYVLICEVLPNALPAALAAFANGLAYFLTGTFFIEIVFGIPGVGRLTQEALRNKDVAVLGGICLLFALAIVLISTLLDALQERLDPRSFQGRGYA